MNATLKEWIERMGGIQDVELSLSTCTHSVIENEEFYPYDITAKDMLDMEIMEKEAAARKKVKA